MKKFLFFICLSLSVMTVSAQQKSNRELGKVLSEHAERMDYLDTFSYINVDSIMRASYRDDMLVRISPTYLTEFARIPDWKSHWFAGVHFGTATFIGKPAGCGDIFDRTSPSWGLYIGKWHSPVVGTRIAFNNGFFKNADMVKKSFRTYHADFLYNVTNHLMAGSSPYRKWDMIPFVGVGLANGARLYHENCPCNACNGSNNNFMLTYGVQGRYRVHPRMCLTGEIGGFSTFGNFDAVGSKHKFGESMLNVSIGLSVDIGNNKWQHPVDAKPFIQQNDYLINNFMSIHNANKSLYNQHLTDRNTINELRKILEIEGLLDKYGYVFNDKARDKRNYYSGILSLRSRLNAEKNANNMKRRPLLADNDSLTKVISMPIYFFFKKGTTRLTNSSQLINIDEIVRVANEYGITLRIDGAADSATGSAETNRSLSQRRAKYLARQLIERGMDKENIKAFSHGGIKEHPNPEDDRYGRIAIYMDIR